MDVLDARTGMATKSLPLMIDGIIDDINIVWYQGWHY